MPATKPRKQREPGEKWVDEFKAEFFRRTTRPVTHGARSLAFKLFKLGATAKSCGLATAEVDEACHVIHSMALEASDLAGQLDKARRHDVRSLHKERRKLNVEIDELIRHRDQIECLIENGS